ncbi:uncharacterized protein PV09_02703 [Verruconis gallopava]|uniref:GAR domain-containing protein n=1 Tax=Verruconis gallopava TaxID=253628 RepID=A0A0D1YZU1_9PEZI|nr:uncharacterized protein PV09_02703 [Verruconis gallopava]KIW06227.1 hypothetical protein PV09_02703 [Verruconis gallopava]
MASAASSQAVYDSNLTIDAPHFALPATPSRSPYKDTLHRRSPTKQLRPGPKTIVNYDEYHRLVNSDISTVAEKELATRVVRAAEKLKGWCREVEQWGWTGSFDKRYGRPDSDPFERADLSPSLDQEAVKEYDERLDKIDEELQSLEVDDLKEQILGIHRGRSRPSSSYSSSSVSNLVLYDDFQLFVTESLLYSLPYYAKLKDYLKTWNIRLNVFREVPTYLSGLSFLEEILKEAWQGLKHASITEIDPSDIDALDEQLTTAQAALKRKVTELGSQLDRMLDMLEGKDDCLPDAWIDKYENSEKSYGEWSYQADRKLFHLRHADRELLREAAMVKSLSETVEYSLVEPKEPSSSQAQDVATHETKTGLLPEAAVLPLGMDDQRSEDQTKETFAEQSRASVEESYSTLNGDENSAEDDDLQDEEEPVIVEVVHRPVEAVLRRASVASIESFTRDQVKSVDVPSRRSSIASFNSVKRPMSRTFDTPGTPSPAEGQPRRSSRTSPLATESVSDWPDLKFLTEQTQPRTPPPNLPTLRRNSGSSMTSPASDVSDSLNQGDESPSVRASMNHSSKPPLNYTMKKRRNNNSIDASRMASTPFPDQELNLDTSLPTIPASPTKTKSPGSPSVPLEEQISSILESLPARIKLTSSSTPNAPEVKSKHKRRTSTSSTVSATSDAPRSGIRSRAVTPSLTGRPGITLAPADEPGPKRGANDPEIKVYHLMSGNDKPLKLFIRRVGENGERVMVRVGGGWADLGEYLKTYAEHHGHRTVSEGRVEVLGLGNDRILTPTSANSGRNSALGFRSESRVEGAEGRSGSRLGMRTDSRQGMLSDSRRSSTMGSTGYPSITTSNGKDLPGASPATTDSISGPNEDVPTPTSATASANGSQRRGNAFWDEGGSLMGPAAVRKSSEISSEKKEWVDSVVEQAKKVGRKVEFGDLKKVGGTRRVFLKGRTASGTTSAGGATPPSTGDRE